jgi:hypothetical protein
VNEDEASSLLRSYLHHIRNGMTPYPKRPWRHTPKDHHDAWHSWFCFMWQWGLPSFGMWRRVVRYKLTDVSERRAAWITRIKEIALMVEALHLSVASVNLYQITRCQIQEHGILPSLL